MNKERMANVMALLMKILIASFILDLSPITSISLPQGVERIDRLWYYGGKSRELLVDCSKQFTCSKRGGQSYPPPPKEAISPGQNTKPTPTKPKPKTKTKLKSPPPPK
ncbi:hypothetical protein PHJA_001544800 [Phtheirospermum japonicum]|uniref:Uncharacterized protein n=1 Tax=Phtheirospermum japonicum TaxID=374723 RepID=A0A830CCD8_9LAMI|nr:hypothetical protein PHJA_001544800 [Phtheirospermum japonicum]